MRWVFSLFVAIASLNEMGVCFVRWVFVLFVVMGELNKIGCSF